MTNINSEIKNLFDEQVANWELARRNFEGLKTVETKKFDFDGFSILVQFNPARIVSSGAKVDAKTIAERKCFLCAENRPPEQNGIDYGDYEILVNPFPIFPEHFTIPRKEHVPQEIKPYLTDMLDLAQAMSDYLLFYNGPKCGASAPDHMHFQAGTKNFLPLITDYKKLKDTHTDLLVTTENMQLYQIKNYLRSVYCIESNNKASIQDAFNKLYAHFENEVNVEPLMNIVCMYENDKWYVFVLPRKAFRPWQYQAEKEQQLLISPATVEVGGIFITPVENHFEKIKQTDIEDILTQVCFQ